MNKFKKTLSALGLASALALGGTALSATPAAPVIEKAQAASYTSCYLSMDGRTWCYRYGLTWFERYVLGYRDGWVPMTPYWYA